MTPPLVSIIILSHNYAQYIGKTIRSVLAQTYPHWELVIVDDASMDESLEVIRQFDDPRIIVVPLATRHGACRAYNVAYARCSGAYVGSVDADDAYMPEKLARQIEYFEAHPDVDIVGTWIRQINGDGQEVENGVHAAAVNQPRDLNRLETWVFNDHLCHSSALLRKASHDRVGGLNPDLALAPDFELWLRCLAAGHRFAVIPQPLTLYRAHTANVSHTCDSRDLWTELCFLFAAHLAPLLVERGRADLLAPAVTVLTELLGSDAALTIRRRILRVLAAFPLLPRTVPAFRLRMAATFGSDWEGLQTAGARRPGPAPAPPPARPSRARSRRISIVDDYFPNLTTGFRVAEFNWYLEHTDCIVYSTATDFDRVWQEYAAVYPQWAERVRRFDPDEATDCAVVYTVFLTNAFRLLPFAEHHGRPLAFTLFPGGGFELHSARTNLMLSRVGRSERLVKMIVTQEATRRYVVDGGFVAPERVEMVWGIVARPELAGGQVGAKRRWPVDKPTFDVCFVAHKYMSRGVDKGYDTFVEVARRLAERDAAFRFHVAGGFGPGDMELGDLSERVTFHGLQPAHRLPAFFADMDLMISPNVPFRLRPGGIDGFPTACCTDAALMGVAVLCTDPFGENGGAAPRFAPDEEIGIIDTDPGAIVERVMALHADPARLRRLAERGQARCRDVYSVERQLAPRLAMLSSLV